MGGMGRAPESPLTLSAAWEQHPPPSSEWVKPSHLHCCSNAVRTGSRGIPLCGRSLSPDFALGVFRCSKVI